MSVYKNDNRVVLHDDGTATIPDPGSEQGDWRVECGRFGGFVLANDDHHVICEGDRYNQRPKAFDTADEAIAYVIGDPE